MSPCVLVQRKVVARVRDQNRISGQHQLMHGLRTAAPLVFALHGYDVPHAFARIVRHDITAERVRELNPLALILSGGPSSVYELGAPKCDPAIFELGLPILGICYGMQLACQAMGGKVDASPAREFGRAEIHVLDPSEPLFRDVPHETIVWMSQRLLWKAKMTGALFVKSASNDILSIPCG